MRGMIEIGTYEAKTRLPQLLRRVAAGETVTITSRGRLVARLVPIEEDRRAERRVVIEAILAERATRPKVPVEEILSARDTGRRP
jgi:prevent-host-death family protein